MRLGNPTAFGRLALLSASLSLVAGCGGGSQDFRHPYILTFNPSTGKMFSVFLVPPEDPMGGDLFLGLGHEGWNLSPERRYGLAFDRDSNRLTQVLLRDFEKFRLGRTFLDVADFTMEDVEISAGGRFALVRAAGFAPFEILDFESLDAPLSSGDLTPSGTVRDLLFSPDDAFGVLRFSTPAQRIEIADFSDLTDPLVPYDLDLEGTLEDLRFVPSAPGVFVAIEGGTGRFRTLRFLSREETLTPLVGVLDLGDDTASHVALLHQSLGAAVASGSGRVDLVDFSTLETPIVLGSFDLGTTLGAFRLAISPDDRFVAIGEIDTGRIFLLEIEQPLVPILVGAFTLGGALTDLRFSSEDFAADFRKAPSLLAVAAGSLSMVDLADPFRPILGPGVGDSLTTAFVWRMRDRLLLSGVDSSGQVSTFDTTARVQAILLVTKDLGLGSGLSRTKVGFR